MEQVQVGFLFLWERTRHGNVRKLCKLGTRPRVTWLLCWAWLCCDPTIHTCSSSLHFAAHNISIHVHESHIIDDNADLFIFSLVHTVRIIHHTAGNVMWHAKPRKRKKSFTCRDSKRQGNSTRVLYFDCHLRTEGLRVWKVPCNFESIIIDDDWWCLVSCWLSLSLSISALLLSCYFRIVALIKLSSFPLPFFLLFRIQQRARNISDIWSKREASQCNVLHSSKQLNIPGVIWIIQRFYPSSNLDWSIINNIGTFTICSRDETRRRSNQKWTWAWAWTWWTFRTTRTWTWTCREKET